MIASPFGRGHRHCRSMLPTEYPYVVDSTAYRVSVYGSREHRSMYQVVDASVRSQVTGNRRGVAFPSTRWHLVQDSILPPRSHTARKGRGTSGSTRGPAATTRALPAIGKIFPWSPWACYLSPKRLGCGIGARPRLETRLEGSLGRAQRDVAPSEIGRGERTHLWRVLGPGGGTWT